MVVTHFTMANILAAQVRVCVNDSQGRRGGGDYVIKRDRELEGGMGEERDIRGRESGEGERKGGRENREIGFII